MIIVIKINDEKKIEIINSFINRTIDKKIVENKDGSIEIPCVAYIFLVKLFKFDGEFTSDKLQLYNNEINKNIGIYNKLLTKYDIKLKLNL